MNAEPAVARRRQTTGLSFALVGNPNAGKTTLFNALTGLRAKTSNFPGTTIEHRSGRTDIGGRAVELIDLPGLYSVNGVTAEERAARNALTGLAPGLAPPDVVVLLLDATNLERNLYLASQVLELGRPTVAALNMIDLAERDGIRIDVAALARELGCPVVPVSARSGRGLAELKAAMARVAGGGAPESDLPLAGTKVAGCAGCPFAARYDWAERVGQRCMHGTPVSHGRQTERIDRLLTHPVAGTTAFLGVMLAVFALIFWIAQFPMGWIEQGFGAVGAAVARWLPAGDLRGLLVDGVVGGVGGVLVFLPQICILFFFLALLEDTGYLARAAFVMDRLMRKVGLPGKAFVPMLSAHACAVPAIMATRVIDGWRDRLVTVLVLPLLTCSARIPVYTMVVALLFPGRPLLASGLFTGAYVLGIAAALGMAWVFRHTILPGETRPLVLELPSYKLPSLRTALLTMGDRALVFLRNAGTVILLISITLWALATYPKSEPPAAAEALRSQSARAADAGQADEALRLARRADELARQHGLAHSAAGRLGRWIEPALRPLGFDWQIGVGVLSSFAAREVIVSTLAIVYGVGEQAIEDDPRSLLETLRAARRSNGAAVFDFATCASLLVFYVLAMQCLPTQVVARRETGGWRWPLFQLGYMTLLAYGGACVTYQLLTRLALG
jgi:ferrous iron transport protein B